MQINETMCIEIICGLVATYVIYSLMNQFLPGGKYSKKIEQISYIGYFILSMLCYFLCQIPIVLLIFNLLSFVLLSMNYIADMKQRLIAVVYIYGILFIIEMLVAVGTGYIHFPLEAASEYSSILGQIANQLLGLLIVAIVKRRAKKRKYVSLPLLYWVCIVTIPLFSLYFLIILFHIGKWNRINTILNMLFIVLINFSIIRLYDLVIDAMEDKTEKLLFEQQNKYYEKQLGIMQVAFKANNSLQHDLKEHLLVLKTYLNEDLNRDASNYVDKMIQVEMMERGEFVRSGNTIIDSILNFKFQEATEKGIQIDTNVCIPENLKIEAFDITVVIGNLLDNAIDAVSKLKDNKEISFELIYNRRRLMLLVTNPYNGEVKENNGILLTSKKESLFHGIGLQNVENIVKKYNGTMDWHSKEHKFEICIMLYI